MLLIESKYKNKGDDIIRSKSALKYAQKQERLCAWRHVCFMAENNKSRPMSGSQVPKRLLITESTCE